MGELPVTGRIFCTAALLALAACDAPPADERVMGETPPDSEWVAENPTEPAVPVDLPEVEMTNVPAETPEAGAPATPTP
jgi:hypothetical protein